MPSNRYSFIPHGPSVILSPEQLERRRVQLAAFVERNKSRRRRGEDPPAAVAAPLEPRPKGPSFSGGAAAALTFDEA
jgi:hypothetical protein